MSNLAFRKLDLAPKDLLKAANKIQDQFTNEKGVFDAKAFARDVGVSLDQATGFITQIVQDRKTKKLKTLNLDKGVKYSQWTREQAEEIPTEVEKLIKGMTEGDTLWPLFQDYVSSGLKGAKQRAVEATQPRWQIDQGHAFPVGGDESGAGLLRNPHVEGNIYNEPKRSRNFDNRDRIIGNIRRNSKAALHFDKKDNELAGGQIANDWLEVIAQFLTDGMTGTNVDELTQETVERARDEGMSLQQSAAIQDRDEQLAAQDPDLKRGAWQLSNLFSLGPRLTNEGFNNKRSLPTGYKGNQFSLGANSHDLWKNTAKAVGKSRLANEVTGGLTGTVVDINNVLEDTFSGNPKKSAATFLSLTTQALTTTKDTPFRALKASEN